MLVYAVGRARLDCFKSAFETTLRLLDIIGARASPEKSYTFSSERAARKSLRRTAWQAIQGATVKVILHT